MDLMEIRRRMLMSSGKKDYLKGVEWVLNHFIGSGGGISSSNLLKYTVSIPLDSGEYMFSGTMGNNGGAVYTRVHAYDADDRWMRQLQTLDIRENTNFTHTIAVPSNVYAIRISTGISIEATLTKV